MCLICCGVQSSMMRSGLLRDMKMFSCKSQAIHRETGKRASFKRRHHASESQSDYLYDLAVISNVQHATPRASHMHKTFFSLPTVY
eukprot:6212598-Pleurochrysis_carterae.AAC.2